MKPEEQLKTLKSIKNIPSFSETLIKQTKRSLVAADIEILQINVGKLCNMSCKHCHVEAGPYRTEIMKRPVFEKCLEIIKAHNIPVVDITGGAPEMNPELEWFINGLSHLDCRIIVRSNLTILKEPQYKKYIDLFTDNKIEIAASLPDHNQRKSERQRGGNSYETAIEVIRELNRRGYGMEGTGLVLDIVHNPVGAYLPASQQSIEITYKRNLEKQHSISFNRLFCLTNCPVGRYLDYLVRTDNLQDYMLELSRAFNVSAAENVMCRTTLSVGWDGTLYDCDFNQMLEIPVNHGAPDHINEFNREKLKNRTICIDNHCFSCTAGSGSSCQGTTACES